MAETLCLGCRKSIPIGAIACAHCGAGVGGTAVTASPFNKPATPPSQSSTQEPTRAKSRSPSSAPVYRLAIGIVVVIVFAALWHAAFVQSNRQQMSAASTSPASSSQPDVQETPRPKWAMRLSSFDEVNHVTLPTVPAGFVRGFSSLAACEEAIRPGLQRWASREVAKVPGSEWFWNDKNPHMAGVSDGDQRRTWVRAWCVEE